MSYFLKGHSYSSYSLNSRSKRDNIHYWQERILHFLFTPEGKHEFHVTGIKLDRLGYNSIISFIRDIPPEEIARFLQKGVPPREIKKGYKVYWKNGNVAESGVLKWAGVIEGEKILGLELDKKQCVTYKGYDGKNLFYCRPGHRALVLQKEVHCYKDFLREFLQTQNRLSPPQIPQGPASVPYKQGERVYFPADGKYGTIKETRQINESTVIIDVLVESTSVNDLPEKGRSGGQLVSMTYEQFVRAIHLREEPLDCNTVPESESLNKSLDTLRHPVSVKPALSDSDDDEVFVSDNDSTNESSEESDVPVKVHRSSEYSGIARDVALVGTNENYQELEPKFTRAAYQPFKRHSRSSQEVDTRRFEDKQKNSVNKEISTEVIYSTVQKNNGAKEEKTRISSEDGNSNFMDNIKPKILRDRASSESSIKIKGGRRRLNPRKKPGGIYNSFTTFFQKKNNQDMKEDFELDYETIAASIMYQNQQLQRENSEKYNTKKNFKIPVSAKKPGHNFREQETQTNKATLSESELESEESIEQKEIIRPKKRRAKSVERFTQTDEHWKQTKHEAVKSEQQTLKNDASQQTEEVSSKQKSSFKRSNSFKDIIATAIGVKAKPSSHYQEENLEQNDQISNEELEVIDQAVPNDNIISEEISKPISPRKRNSAAIRKFLGIYKGSSNGYDDNMEPKFKGETSISTEDHPNDNGKELSSDKPVSPLEKVNSFRKSIRDRIFSNKSKEGADNFVEIRTWKDRTDEKDDKILLSSVDDNEHKHSSIPATPPALSPPVTTSNTPHHRKYTTPVFTFASKSEHERKPTVYDKVFGHIGEDYSLSSGAKTVQSIYKPINSSKTYLNRNDDEKRLKQTPLEVQTVASPVKPEIKTTVTNETHPTWSACVENLDRYPYRSSHSSSEVEETEKSSSNEILKEGKSTRNLAGHRKPIDQLPDGMKKGSKIQWLNGEEKIHGTVRKLYKDDEEKYTAVVKFDNDTREAPPLLREGDGYLVFVEQEKNNSDESDELPSPFMEYEIQLAAGKPRGIPSYEKNGCVENILFSMYYTCDKFDISTLYENNYDDHVAKSFKTILREEVVKPMRNSGICKMQSVVRLYKHIKSHLSEVGPLEMEADIVLFILFQQIFKTGKFILYSNDTSDHLHQIVTNRNDFSQSITMQSLFESSLHVMETKLKTIPTPALILEVPRANGMLQQYKAVIPNLILKISHLIEEGPRVCLCGQVGRYECTRCIQKIGNKALVFCENCRSVADHIHFQIDHDTDLIEVQQAAAELDLAAVICLNGDEYCSFVKIGKERLGPWLYFDINQTGEPMVSVEQNLGSWLERLERIPETFTEALPITRLKQILVNPYICIYTSRQKGSLV